MTRRAEQSPLNPLQHLIRERMETEGWTYRDLERRTADDSGRPLVTYGGIQKLATQPMRRGPKNLTVGALARALGVSERTVRSAVYEALQLDAPGEPRRGIAHDLADRAELLPEDAHRHVCWALERMIEAAEATVANDEGRTNDRTTDRRDRAARILGEFLELDEETQEDLAERMTRARSERRPSVNGVS